jgi:hypothetical protein
LPTISRFYGIEIGMFYNNHEPAHFHAVYSGRQAAIRIDSLEIFRGSLPRSAERLVKEWAAMHVEELTENWLRARAREPRTLFQIEGLE